MADCSVTSCIKPVKNSGMCWTHYTRKRRHGDVNIVKPRGGIRWPYRAAIERFMDLVEIAPNGCWNWAGLHDKDGYARFYYGFIDGRPRIRRASRWAYRWFRGDFDPSLQIDHLCRNRGCVNPDHLEPVTCGENIRRGESGLVSGAIQRAKTHCPAGHPYSGDNLYIYPSSGGRACRICIYAGNKRRREQKAAGAVRSP